MKRSVSPAVTILIALATATVALAGYKGPNRQYTENWRDPDNDVWTCTNGGASCWFQNPSNPCPDYGGYPPSRDFQITWCGWVAERCYCTEAFTTVEVNDPAASISGSLTCGSQGENGWCTEGPSLNLSANEPVGGYVIQYIEGSPGLLCDPPDAANVSCSWTSGGEGSYSIDYWAVTSYGDTSAMSSTTWSVDTVPPSVTMNVTGGEVGANGWYLSGPVTISAGGSDSTSGLQSAQVSIGGGAWSPSLEINGDGVHAFDLQAVDNAGLLAQSTGNVMIDSTPPNVGLGISGGQKGNADWYRGGPVTVSANCSDATSGISSAEVSVGGSAWQPSIQISGDGFHSIEVRAADSAGNLGSGSGTIKIDGQSPTLNLSVSGRSGGAGWFIANPVRVQASASDNLSGVAGIDFSLDNGPWQGGNSVDISGEGSHTVSFRVRDGAGNETMDRRTVQVDTVLPSTQFTYPEEGSKVWLSGEVTLTGVSTDATSGLASAQISFDEGASWSGLQLSSNTWSQVWDTTTVSDGTYLLQARARDVAGNQESTAQVTVFVDNHPPIVEIPDSWQVSQAAPLKVVEEGVLAGVEILIGSEGLGTRKLDFEPDQVPEFITWDQRFEGGEAAPIGEYSVIARAWDLAGNEGMDTAVIVVPGPEAKSTPRPSIVTNPINPLVEETQPNSDSAKPADKQANDLIIPEPLKRFIHLWLWPVLAMIGMMISVGVAKATDPRPRALKRIMKEFAEYQTLNDTFTDDEKG